MLDIIDNTDGAVDGNTDRIANGLSERDPHEGEPPRGTNGVDGGA